MICDCRKSASKRMKEYNREALERKTIAVEREIEVRNMNAIVDRAFKEVDSAVLQGRWFVKFYLTQYTIKNVECLKNKLKFAFPGCGITIHDFDSTKFQSVEIIWS